MALMILFMTELWTTTRIHITGDESVRDQIRQLKDGKVEYNFPERLVLISNHQVRSSLSHPSRSKGVIVCAFGWGENGKMGS